MLTENFTFACGSHEIFCHSFYWHLISELYFELCSIIFYHQNEVARAIELREIVTSLGPAYIKLGQALSIRPDILSPSAMLELQKLCDKVKLSFSFCLLFIELTSSVTDAYYIPNMWRRNTESFNYFRFMSLVI